MEKKTFLLIFVTLIFLLTPLTVYGDFLELHGLKVILACKLVEEPKAVELCDNYIDEMISFNFATDYSVLFYFQEDGKFYRFTHARQFYNELLRLAGSNKRFQAGAVGSGTHHQADVNSHGHDGISGYTGETIKKWFLTNTIGHPIVERNMINSIFSDGVTEFEFRGRTIQITQQEKELALFYKANALDVFNSDEELLNFFIEAHEEISAETIRNSIAVVDLAVSGDRENSVWGENFTIPTFWWAIAFIAALFGLLFTIVYIFAFVVARGIFVRLFIAQWIIIFLILSIIGGVAIFGLFNGQIFLYYEDTIDFFAGFIKPQDADKWLAQGVENTVQFLETGTHKFGDASGWDELGKDSNRSFIFLVITSIYWIISSLFILSRIRKKQKLKKLQTNVT